MRKRLVLLALSVALLAALPGTAALAASGDRTPIGTRPPALPHQARAATDAGSATFDFFGSGWGHGIGFSQWGAYGLAQFGWTHQQMLTHYYTGSTVGPAPAGSPTFLRVGLSWDRSALHLKANGGDVVLRRGGPTNKDFLTIPNGYQWTIQAVSPGQFKITNAVGTVVATVGGTHWQLDAVFQSPSSRVTIPEAGHAYSRGYIEMNVYRPCSACNWDLRAIAVVSPQEYLYGLGEVPSTWPKEAMEAQVDAARTYAFDVVESDGQHRTSHGDCNCGLYPSSVDQAYDGWDKENQGPGWPAAVYATDNEVVTYQGKPNDAA